MRGREGTGPRGDTRGTRRRDPRDAPRTCRAVPGMVPAHLRLHRAVPAMRCSPACRASVARVCVGGSSAPPWHGRGPGPSSMGRGGCRGCPPPRGDARRCTYAPQCSPQQRLRGGCETQTGSSRGSSGNTVGWPPSPRLTRHLSHRPATSPGPASTHPASSHTASTTAASAA